MTLLFDSVQAAKEVAYMLYEQWDGCNGVIIRKKVDMAAIQVAANLVDAKWCLSEEQCRLLSFINKKELISLIHHLVKTLFVASLIVGSALLFGSSFGQHKSSPTMYWTNHSFIR